MKKIIPYAFLLLFVLGTAKFADAAFIRRGKVKKRATSGYKVVVVVGKKAGDIATASATIATADKEAPQPTLKEFTLKLSEIAKNGNYVLAADLDCTKSNCLFAKDADPLGHSYKLTLTLKDENGKTLGSAESITVEVSLDKSVCVSKQKIEAIQFSGLNFYYPYTKQNASDLMLVTQDNQKEETPIVSWTPTLDGKQQCTSPPAMDMVVVYGLPNEKLKHTYTARAVYDTKTNTYNAKWLKVDSAYTYSFWIKPTGVRNGWTSTFNKPIFITQNAVAFEAKKQKEDDDSNDNSKDSTTNNFVIDQEVKLTSTTVGKLQVIALSNVTVTNNNKLSKEIPTVKAIVFLKGCDGKTANIEITLKYDAKSKTFVGSQGLALCKDKAYEVASISVTVIDNGGTLWTRSELTHF